MRMPSTDTHTMAEDVPTGLDLKARSTLIAQTIKALIIPTPETNGAMWTLTKDLVKTTKTGATARKFLITIKSE